MILNKKTKYSTQFIWGFSVLFLYFLFSHFLIVATSDRVLNTFGYVSSVTLATLATGILATFYLRRRTSRVRWYDLLLPAFVSPLFAILLLDAFGTAPMRVLHHYLPQNPNITTLTVSRKNKPSRRCNKGSIQFKEPYGFPARNFCIFPEHVQRAAKPGFVFQLEVSESLIGYSILRLTKADSATGQSIYSAHSYRSSIHNK